MDGMEIGGVMTISGNAEEGYSGSMDTDMGGASMTNLAVDGQTLTFYIPDADVDVSVTFDGDAFSGTLAGAMGSGSFTGTKRQGT